MAEELLIKTIIVGDGAIGKVRSLNDHMMNDSLHLTDVPHERCQEACRGNAR